jgi:lipopolysaccharide export system protein LptA
MQTQWRNLLALTALAVGLSGVVEVQAAPAGSGKEPIEITADKLDVMQEQQQAIFSGNVLAKQGEVTIKGDQMVVYYRNAEEAKSGGDRIRQIDVNGNVLLTTQQETATGQKGTYYVDKKTLRLFGDVVLTQGKNVLKGGGLEYNMATGKSQLVGQGAASGGATGGRVRGLFLPE